MTLRNPTAHPIFRHGIVVLGQLERLEIDRACPRKAHFGTTHAASLVPGELRRRLEWNADFLIPQEFSVLVFYPPFIYIFHK